MRHPEPYGVRLLGVQLDRAVGAMGVLVRRLGCCVV